MTNVHTGHAVELLTVPLHKRGGFALLASGVIVAIACLPGLIHGLSQMLEIAFNPGVTAEGTLAQSFGQALVPILLFATGVTLVSIGSNRRALQKRAAVESVLAALIVDAERAKQLAKTQK